MVLCSKGSEFEDHLGVSIFFERREEEGRGLVLNIFLMRLYVALTDKGERIYVGSSMMRREWH